MVNANALTEIKYGWTVHPSHHWIPADDIIECAQCMCRIYNDEAKLPCPDDPGHGGPDN